MSEVIGVASDHGGRDLRLKIGTHLLALGVVVRDFGVGVEVKDSVDYPDYAVMLAEALEAGIITSGVLVCGTGIGMSIAANKFPTVRAALVWDEFTARMAKEHNNANILCLGARVINHDRALDLVDVWRNSSFVGGRHLKRVEQLAAIADRILNMNKKKGSQS